MTSFSYAISDAFVPVFTKDEDGKKTGINRQLSKKKKDEDEEIERLQDMIIGFMCHLPIKLTVDKIYTRSVVYNFEYLKYKHDFIVYFPTNVSPEEARIRIDNKLRKHFFTILTGHNEFEDLKEFFVADKKKHYKLLEPAFKQIAEEMKLNKQAKFNDWIEMRNTSMDEEGYRICYCGHTDTCECSNPCQTLFEESIKNKTLDPSDPKNGWKKAE